MNVAENLLLHALPALVCDEPQVNFENSYPYVEQYSWLVDWVEVSTNSSFLLSSIDQPSYEVMLTASNPLCTETTIQLITKSLLSKPSIHAVQISTAMETETHKTCLYS
jgi:hypothetical protein